MGGSGLQVQSYGEKWTFTSGGEWTIGPRAIALGTVHGGLSLEGGYSAAGFTRERVVKL